MNEENVLLKDLVEHLPIEEVYDDLLHPTLSTIGQTLQGVTRIALAPVSALIWGYEKISDYLDTAIPAYFEKNKIKTENIISPDPNIAVPAIEAMRYSANIPELREMFTNLLGASMNGTQHEAHPAFVEIIKQLCPDECKMLKYLMNDDKMAMLKYRIKLDTGGEADVSPYMSTICSKSCCQFPEKFSTYLDNLHRLGLITVEYDRYLVDDKYYEEIRSTISINKSNSKIIEKRSLYGLSSLGRQFCNICISQ